MLRYSTSGARGLDVSIKQSILYNIENDLVDVSVLVAVRSVNACKANRYCWHWWCKLVGRRNTPKVGCFCSLKAVFSRYSKNEKIVEKFFIYGKNIVFKRLTPIANGGKIVKLRIKD